VGINRRNEMEVKLPDILKAQYDTFLQSAQQIETTIGSNQFRIQKLLDMRKEIELSLKKWWDEVLVELKLEKNRDYMITQDGAVKDVTPPKEPTKPTDSIARTVEELK
jgi:hypothetical protein